MAKKEPPSVTMRVRVGENELEVTGPSDFVEKKIDEFVSNQKEWQKTTPVAEALKRFSQPTTQVTTKSSKKMSLAQFFRRILLQSHADRFLAAGYYLEKYENEENFTAAELSRIVKSGAKKPPPKNPNDVVNGNIKKGLMMTAGDKDGKIAFVLTSDGEEVIDDLLNA